MKKEGKIYRFLYWFGSLPLIWSGNGQKSTQIRVPPFFTENGTNNNCSLLLCIYIRIYISALIWRVTYGSDRRHEPRHVKCWKELERKIKEWQERKFLGHHFPWTRRNEKMCSWCVPHHHHLHLHRLFTFFSLHFLPSLLWFGISPLRIGTLRWRTSLLTLNVQVKGRNVWWCEKKLKLMWLPQGNPFLLLLSPFTFYRNFHVFPSSPSFWRLSFNQETFSSLYTSQEKDGRGRNTLHFDPGKNFQDPRTGIRREGKQIEWNFLSFYLNFTSGSSKTTNNEEGVKETFNKWWTSWWKPNVSRHENKYDKRDSL